MKNTIIALLLGGFALGAQAQEVNFGVTGGLNLSNVTGDYDDTDMKTGGNFGVFAEIEAAERISVQPELKYSMQGFKGGNNIYKDLALDYVNIPVKVKFAVTDEFDLFVGPQFGFNTKAEIESAGKDVKLDDNTTSTDVGGLIGAEYITCEGFGAGLGYNFGLTNTIDKEVFPKIEDAKNSVINLNLIYRFDY